MAGAGIGFADADDALIGVEAHPRPIGRDSLDAQVPVETHGLDFGDFQRTDACAAARASGVDLPVPSIARDPAPPRSENFFALSGCLASGLLLTSKLHCH